MNSVEDVGDGSANGTIRNTYHAGSNRTPIPFNETMVESEDKLPKPPPQPPPWKSQDWIEFLKAVEPYADKYLQFIRERGEEEHKLSRLGSNHEWRIAWVSFVFLGVLVGLMSWLTSIGRVSGDALLFLAGTITGYIFSLIVKFRWYGPSEEEEA